MFLNNFSQQETKELYGKSKIEVYSDGNIIFNKNDIPQNLHVLLEGEVCICNFDENGAKQVVTNIMAKGDTFGEVFLFVDTKYEHTAIASGDAKVLKIPRNIALQNHKISQALISIFAKKAYVLNKRVQILYCKTLREKLNLYFELNKNEFNIVKISQTRDALADYLNVTRPSLSRELMNMQRDGLISIEKTEIKLMYP